jgi:hypothetical protein
VRFENLQAVSQPTLRAALLDSGTPLLEPAWPGGKAP